MRLFLLACFSLVAFSAQGASNFQELFDSKTSTFKKKTFEEEGVSIALAFDRKEYSRQCNNLKVICQNGQSTLIYNVPYPTTVSFSDQTLSIKSPRLGKVYSFDLNTCQLVSEGYEL